MVQLPSRIESRIERIPISGCWLWLGYVDAIGYGRISINGKAGARLHREVFELTVRKLLDNECVLHSCDVRSCCNPAHLFVGSKTDNNIDKAKKGRANKRLSIAEVLAVRSMSGTNREIASIYSISRSMVSMIKTMKVRKYI